MTAALQPAEPATDRARRGGRAGKRSSAAAAFEQPAFRQLKNPLQPTSLISDDELESIHLASLQVLKEIGVDVLHEDARRIMKEHGADVREGSERVRFDGEIYDAGSKIGFLMANVAYALEREELSADFRKELEALLRQK